MQRIKPWATMGVLAIACSSSPASESESGWELERNSTTEQKLCASPQLNTLVLPTGVELAYLEQGARWGKPVIFLHGYTDSHHSFDRNLPIFPRSFHVFALDQRGHGASSKPACCYTQADFAADVVSFMDAVGLSQASIVGHSMGSLIAHKVAVSYPERVDRLVLIGSTPTANGNPLVTEFAGIVDALVDPIDPEFVRSFQASTFFRPIPEGYLDTLVRESLKVPAIVWQQAMDGMLAEDHASELVNITAPTLVLYGDEDAYFTAAEQEELAHLIPNSALVIYPQTGHGIHAELPRAVVRDLRRFLR